MTGGGYNSWLLYRVNDTGSAYVIKTAAGSAAATAPTDAVITLTELEGVKLDRQSDGSYKISFDQHQAGGLFDAFAAAWIETDDTVAGLPAVEFIDGVSSTASASSDLLLLIAKGAIDPDDDTKRLVRCFLSLPDPTSGSEEIKSGTSMKPALILNSIKASYNLVIDEALFGPGFSATPGDQTLSAGAHILRASLAKA